MSLFNARDKQLVEKNPYLKLPQDAGSEDGNILDPLLFQSILHRVVDDQKAELTPGYRTRINDCRWRIQNLLGNVNETIWEGMVKAALKGMEATIHNAQPNGTWLPCECESRIAQNSKTLESFLEVVVRFVDTANAPELAYQDGRPVVNVTVQQAAAPAMDQKMLDLLSQKAESDADMKLVLASVVQLLAKQATAADALPAKPLREEEPVVEAPKAKKGRASAAVDVEAAENTDRAALAALASLPVIK
jgi:hypothetical protein